MHRLNQSLHSYQRRGVWGDGMVWAKAPSLSFEMLPKGEELLCLDQIFSLYPLKSLDPPIKRHGLAI